MGLRKERDRYRDELTKVLKEREKLKEELEYERNVCGKDAEVKKLLQHCTVDELERVCQERDDLREKVSTSERDDDEEETRQKVLIASSHSHITELEKQISEMQETEQRLRKQRDELDATAKRYKSERNAMRIGVVDALDRVQKKLQGKQREEDIIALNDVFAISLKNAHKGIEILQTYNNEGEHATKVLIELIKIYDRNYHNIREEWIRDILQGCTGNELQNLRNERDAFATIAHRYKEKYKETQTILDLMHGMVLECQQLVEMNAKDEEFLRMSNLPPGPPLVD